MPANGGRRTCPDNDVSDVIVLCIVEDRIGGTDRLQHMIADAVFRQMQWMGPILESDEPLQIDRAPCFVGRRRLADDFGLQDRHAGQPRILPRGQHAGGFVANLARQRIAAIGQVDCRENN